MHNGYLSLLVVAFLLCGAPVLRAQTTVMVGETELEVRNVITGIDIPWETIWGPDDHIWFTERIGRISRVNPETSERQILLDLTATVHQEAESGMLGLALHPDFINSPHVFVAYTYLDEGNDIRERIVRYTYDEDTLTDPFILIEDIQGNSTHDGCRLLILPDMTLLATTGDAQQPFVFSQDPSELPGKILRMHLDGSIPDDNPFGPDSYTYTYGHRNAQGLVRTANGKLFSTEHGPSTNDELNRIEAGHNYGWPLIEGLCDLPSEETDCNALSDHMEPLAIWNANSTIAPSDLIFYNHPSIPEWQGRLLVTVLKNKHVRAVKLDTDNEVLEDVEYLNEEFGRLRDICASPDGRVFLATNGSSWANTQPNTHRIVELKNPLWTGVAESGTSRLTVWPNPASTSINVQLVPEMLGARLLMYDALGHRIIDQSANAQSIRLEVNSLPAGMYSLVLVYEGKSTFEHIILSR